MTTINEIIKKQIISFSFVIFMRPRLLLNAQFITTRKSWHIIASSNTEAQEHKELEVHRAYD